MKYYCNLYMSEKLGSKKADIISKLENNAFQFEKYLIVLARGNQNHLEIFNAVLLLQKTISKEDIFVVGIANGYEESLELVEKITREVYDITKGTDIRSYILQTQKEYEEGNV